MADIAGVVDALREAVEHVEKFRKRLPAPFDAGEHSVAAQILGTFEIAEHQVRLALAARRQGETAVAHNHGGDAVIARAGADRIPEYLGVHMGVAVDEARRDHVAVGVDGLPARRSDTADEGDLAFLDADVGAIARQAGAVDHHAVLDHQIVAHCIVLYPGEIHASAGHRARAMSPARRTYTLLVNRRFIVADRPEAGETDVLRYREQDPHGRW